MKKQIKSLLFLSLLTGFGQVFSAKLTFLNVKKIPTSFRMYFKPTTGIPAAPIFIQLPASGKKIIQIPKNVENSFGVDVIDGKKINDISFKFNPTSNIFAVNSTTKPSRYMYIDLYKILQSILEKDDVKSLQFFIKTYPKFPWTMSEHIIWSKETITPLIAAVFYNAFECVQYLLSKNTGSIRSSLLTKSSHNLLPIQYTEKNARYKNEKQRLQMENLLKKFNF